MPGISPPMRLKGDPHKNVKLTCQKHDVSYLFDDGEVEGWLAQEPGSPGALKKAYIMGHAIDHKGNQTMDDWEIDLKDPTTWPGDAAEDIPPDQFFLDLFKAIKADQKRNDKRSSYEF